jgi:hypothetical protein
LDIHLRTTQPATDGFTTSLPSKKKKSVCFPGALRKATGMSIPPCIYNAYINSHVLYGSEAWGFCTKSKINSLQIIQNKAIRRVGQYSYSATQKTEEFKLLNVLNLIRFAQLKFLFN